MPAPTVSGAMVRCSAVSSSSWASTTGQMCSQTWFMSSCAPFVPGRRPGPADRLQAAGDGPLDVRQRDDLGRPASRTMASWRTWASATSRWSASLSSATQW